jgi:hypothetical protein
LFIGEIEVVPVIAGEPVAIDVNESQPYVYLSFTGERDRVLSLFGERLEGDATFDIAVRSPSGQIINNASQTEDGTVSLDPMFLNIDGSYIMIVSRALVFPSAVPSGRSVSLRLTLREVETQQIAVGDTISGILDNENPVDHYLFSGTPDEILRLAGSQTEDSQTYEILIYTQEGSVFYGISTANPPRPGSFVLDPLQLAEAGEYLLFVHRLDLSGLNEWGTTEYTFTLSPTETPVLETGGPVQATLDSETYEYVYRFEGAADQTIRISLSSQGEGYAPGLSVQGPPLPQGTDQEGSFMNFYLNISGNTAAALTYEVTLPVDGVYLFRVNNAAFSQTGFPEGNFRLVLEAVD